MKPGCNDLLKSERFSEDLLMHDDIANCYSSHADAAWCIFSFFPFISSSSLCLDICNSRGHKLLQSGGVMFRLVYMHVAFHEASFY